MKSHVSPVQGMTILEVLLATALLGAIAVTVFSAFLIGLRAAALAGGMNTAAGLAQEALATATASSCGSSMPMDDAVEPEDRRLGRYHREVTLAQVPDTNLWEWTVRISWTQERRLRTVTLKTFRYVSAACRYLSH